MKDPWFLDIEEKYIKKYGGIPDRSMGYDGLLDNKPVEVKAIKKDDRFRINEIPHRKMVSEKGYYIFVCLKEKKERSKLLFAKEVDKLLNGCCWFTDRDYFHRFIKSEKIFK